MNTDRFLVTGANGDIANAIGRVLRASFPEALVVGADLGECWPGRITFSDMYTLPRASEPEYLDKLFELIDIVKAGCVIPCTEPEIAVLSKHKALFESAPILLNDAELVDIGLDKYRTMCWLGDLGDIIPRTKKLGEAQYDGRRLIVKPRFGCGSRNIELVDNQDKLELLSSELDGDEYVVQEYIPADLGEYTCVIFKSPQQERTLAMKRWLVGGLTGRMKVEPVPSIHSVLALIAEQLPETANINVQLRMSESGPKIFEINPRISSTVMMRHKVGFSDLLWWIQAKMGKKLPEYCVNEGAEVFRTYDEVVVNHQ